MNTPATLASAEVPPLAYLPAPRRVLPHEHRFASVRTPVLFRRILAVMVVLLVAVAFATCESARLARRALQVVGQDSAPSIVLALRLRTAVSDLDANLVNQFLTAPETRDRENARQANQRRRDELGALIVAAAGNVTFGAAERTPLIELVRDLARYEAEMSRAQTLEETGAHGAAVVVARRAHNLVQTSLQRSAKTLEDVNRDAFDAAYHEAGSRLHSHRIFLLITVVAAGAALVFAQVVHRDRTRRLLNPGLLAASALFLFFALPAVARLGRAADALRVAKEDAFESVSLLWRARALANAANGLESRWLFDRTLGTELGAAFHENLHAVLRLPPGSSWSQVPDLRSPGALPAGSSGLLAQALANVTFTGEREELHAAVAALARYAVIDTQVRQLTEAGQREGAIALCLSYSEDGSNGAFDRLEAALERALEINQRAFETRITEGLEATRHLSILAVAATTLIAAASAGGIWLRLREYRA